MCLGFTDTIYPQSQLGAAGPQDHVYTVYQELFTKKTFVICQLSQRSQENIREFSDSVKTEYI